MDVTVENVECSRGIKSIFNEEFGFAAVGKLSFLSFLGWRLLGFALCLFYLDKKYLVWHGEKLSSLDRHGNVSASICAMLFFVATLVGVLSLLFFGADALSTCASLVIGTAVIAAIAYRGERSNMISGATLSYMHHLHSIRTDTLLEELNQPHLDRRSMSLVAEVFRIKRKDKSL